MVGICLLFLPKKKKSKQTKEGIKSLKHISGFSKDFKKRGFNVSVNVRNQDDEDSKANALESAMRTLKKRTMQEGQVKELRKREFYQSKGQKRRRAFQNAVMREKKRLFEDRKEWDPDLLIGMHQNKKKKQKNNS